MRETGVPNRSLIIGRLLAIAGFFVVPVVGAVIGFVGGVYPDGVAVVQIATAAPFDQRSPERRGRCHVTELW